MHHDVLSRGTGRQCFGKHNCPEALFPSVPYIKTRCSSPPSRKIIQLCEGDQKAWTRLLDLGGLSLGFWVITKWIAVNVVSEWDQPVQGPFSDLGFSHFREKVKNLYPSHRTDSLPWYGTLGKFWLN